MVLKIDNLEVNVKGLGDTTTLGDYGKHAYERMVTPMDCGEMFHVMIVRLTV